jgi:phytoene dehydrogenase-like protein
MTGREAFDGIIIGAGHHGLILGSYLQKAGLRILLVDRRMMYGGGLSTEERTLPGFYHNLHSVNHFSITSTPWFKDLELDARVRYIVPDYEFGQPHEDGSAIVFSRHLQETLASISRFSKNDADTFREWNAKAEAITRTIFMKERYSEPLSEHARAEIVGATPLGREFLELTERAPLDVINEIFEDERVKTLFLFKVALFGTILKESMVARSPVGSLVRAFDLSTGYELCAGGSWNLARGLMETFIAAGGTFRNQVQISKIEVQDNQAVGITLHDGVEYSARRFVASTLDPHQTFVDLVGTENLPGEYNDKVANFQHLPWTLYGLHLALKEPPRYLASSFDPNIDKVLKYSIGTESMASLLEGHDDVEAGRIPSHTQFGAGSLTQLDPTQAPPGRHTAYAWHVVPFAPDGRHAKLLEVREEMTERILSTWRQYAPNMTEDNILASYTHTAYEYSRELVNMRMGDMLIGALTANQVMDKHFGYRTPIDGLYMAGSPTHPNGAVTGGGGYIAASVIARDLGIQPWWKPWSVATDLAGNDAPTGAP